MNMFLMNPRPPYFNTANRPKEARVRRAEAELDDLIRTDVINHVVLGEIYSAMDGRYYYQRHEAEQLARC